MGRIGGRNASGRAFTLIEGAMAAIVLGLLAAATLNSVSAAAAGRQTTADRSRGRMLADDLMAEILSKAYVEPPDPAATGLAGPAPGFGLDTGEAGGPGRTLFDDVDDYDGLIESPPKQVDGASLPGLTGWKRETIVVWATVADVKATAASDTTVKRITVRVKRGNKVVGTAVALRTGAWTKALTTGKTAVGSAVVTSVTPK